jgi:flagellar protein FliO/FliZ
MLESLSEVSNPLKFLLVFVCVIAAIVAIAWLLRRFGGERFGGSTARGRQPRLAVVDAAAVDGRRRLVIIRRDNVEHLLMIGGPTDVVVEQNIVRAMGAPREKVEPTLGRGLSIPETLTRPVPLGDGNSFPLQPTPETNGRPARTVPQEPVQWTWPAHSEPQRPVEPQRPARAEPRLEKPDTLSNLADELSSRPTAPREPTFSRPATPPPAGRPAPTPPAPVTGAPAHVVTPATSAPTEKVQKTETAQKTPVADANQNLADMATLLGASLRHASEPRPVAPAQPKVEPIVPPLPSRMTAPEPRVAPEPRITPEPRSTEPKPVRAETKPAQPEAKPKAVYESLEEEMASLLGRPPGKP